MSIINNVITNYPEKPFTTSQAYAVNKEVNSESVRARIYEATEKGILKKIARGIFQNNNGLLIHGNGRDLSFLENNSIDAIITDHPWSDKKSNVGGSRNFVDSYEEDCFQYYQDDFDQKARVLKSGCFCVEFLPEENSNNYEYIYAIKQMAKKAGLDYYACVPWEYTDAVNNCGRKAKNISNIMIFSKGTARSLKRDEKKIKATGDESWRMSGCAKMLPTVFKYPKNKKSLLHQAEKNWELIADLLDYITLPGELVLDQFAGSGSTGVACEAKGRSYILIELLDKYVQIIKNRLNMEVSYD